MRFPSEIVAEEVVASLDVIEDVARVLERSDDLARLEGRDTRTHSRLEGHRNALGDGTPESRCLLDWHTFSVLTQNLEIAGDGLSHSCSRLVERLAFGDDPCQQRDGDRVAAFDSRLEQDRVRVDGALHNLGSSLPLRHDDHLQFETYVQRRGARAAGQLCLERDGRLRRQTALLAQGTNWRFLNELRKELKG